MVINKIDVHCHVDLYSQTELETVFSDRSYLVVGAATGFESGERLLHLAKQYHNLKICLGIHPEDPEGYRDLDRVSEQIMQNLECIVAIGEVGLPWYCLAEADTSRKADIIIEADRLFAHFMNLAGRTGLPVILHAIRESTAAAISQLRKNRIERGLFHWYKGSLEDLEQITKMGFLISVSPDIMYNEAYATFTDHIPLTSLTLESDGPWEYNGKRGMPAMIEATALCLAARRNLDPAEILHTSYENCLKLFGSTLLLNHTQPHTN